MNLSLTSTHVIAGSQANPQKPFKWQMHLKQPYCLQGHVVEVPLLGGRNIAVFLYCVRLGVIFPI